VIDIWKAGAPAIDINAPDVHLPNFSDWAGRFHRPNNPLFVPESYGDAGGAANAFYGIGQHAAIGYSPFGVNHAARWGEPVRRPTRRRRLRSKICRSPGLMRCSRR
jgi:hypothetical protein